jgi:hypothetical protein
MMACPETTQDKEMKMRKISQMPASGDRRVTLAPAKPDGLLNQAELDCVAAASSAMGGVIGTKA